MICSTSGVPRTAQMTMRVSQRRGGNRLMEPKEITSPRGKAPASVMKKSLRVRTNPVFSVAKTV